MASKVFALEQLKVIVGQSNQIKDRFSVKPMQPCWMDVSMDQSVVMHVCDCACDLAEQKEESRRGEVSFTELLPKADMLRAFHFKQKRVALSYLREWFLQVEQVRVGR